MERNKKVNIMKKLSLAPQQIRVHFASIGHPLAGDDLYGGSRERIARQALHAIDAGKIFLLCSEESLRFSHNQSNKDKANQDWANRYKGKDDIVVKHHKENSNKK